MKKQVILRPVFNRPEMLSLCLEYEYKARETFAIPSTEFHTVFVIEYGASAEVVDIVKNYKYEKIIIYRPRRYGLSANILEGMRTAFDITDDYIVYLEDDILVHKSYFSYLYKIMQHTDLQDFSVISAFNFNDDGTVTRVRKDRHYAAWAPLITRRFYEGYVRPHSCKQFYNNPSRYVVALNEQYKDYWDSRMYRYKTDMHHQQAGLINRLCDIARIEEGLYVVMPEVARSQHIGIYGSNRRVGKPLSGDTLSKRIAHLRTIVQDASKMYEMAGSKEYNDYRVFSEKLDEWDGTLTLSDKHYIS